MIDANVILALKPPPDPTEEFAKFQGARNMIAQGQAQQQAQQLNQQKIQEGQLALQEAQRHQQSQEAVRQGFIQANGNPEGTIAAAIKNGAGPDEITALQKHFTGIQKDTAEIDSKELSVKLEKSADILRLHDYASQLAQSNPQQYMQEWPQIAARAKELDPKAADHIDPNTPWTPQQIATSKALHMTQDYFLKSQAEERAVKTTAADIADKNAQAALAGAKTPGAKAESDIAQQKADLMKNYQAGTGPHPIDTALPPELDKTANAAFKSSFDFAMKSGGPEAAQKVLEAAATHAASSSPEKLNADIGKAVATERALTPLKINQAVQTEVQKARLAGGIGQIVDPQQRSEASHALDAADKEAQEKISAAAA